MNPNSRSKVIGIGFHKTGTKTLAHCLRTLGYRHISLSRHHFDLWLKGRTDQILTDMESADSFDDWPWPLLFRQANEYFPDAKFILTTRCDEQKWFQSLVNQIMHQAAIDNISGANSGSQKPFRKYIYGYEDPLLNPEHHINVYRCHNTTVRNYFTEQPDKLLEVCWESGDGWQKLCGFLGVSVPAEPFPWMNASAKIISTRPTTST
ncbi:MAG: sulfotransferase [Chitinophagaceae bacterium]|jgi:hypothetical protein|nr:sulfotransferase [Chitinophagaceae bacterium]